MVWACSTYGGEERRIQDFGWGNLRERDRLGDPGVDGRILSLQEVGCGGNGLDGAGSG
jgi:hypothetical protein